MASDEEMTAHNFVPRFGDGADVWCSECEYHRDHAVHETDESDPAGFDLGDEDVAPDLDPGMQFYLNGEAYDKPAYQPPLMLVILAAIGAAVILAAAVLGVIVFFPK